MKSSLSHRFTSKKSNRGFSMIEVLISIVVMTFGLLGISGLMMKGVDNSTGSDLASRSSQAASQIMDAMRANRANHANYITPFGTTSASITGTTTAETDVKAWLAALERLPGGGGQIRVTGIPETYIVEVRFANCIGSLSTVEKNNCGTATGDVEKRVIKFTFQI